MKTMDRREFVKRALMLPASAVVLIGRSGWAMRALPGAKSNGRLIVVFLRGAVDGLNVLIPYGDSRYYELRPNIAIQKAGAAGRIQDLDGHFGLHPALAPMMALWRERSLAFVHACGSPDPTRSHFDAQDFMESGTPGIKTTADGWMNRLLAVLPRPHSPTEAMSLGPTVPRILSGKMPVANLPVGRMAARPMPLDRPRIETAFDKLYGGGDALAAAYREGREARKRLLAALEQDMRVADAGAPLPAGFSNETGRLARLIRHDPTIRLAFMALGGWDTHVNEGAADGQLANHLRPLGEGLAALAKELGPAYADTAILVVSEFGRTVRENGNGGTDHGHGNVMWIMGGGVRGGRVYGKWPGLDDADLYQGRDLPVTSDFRNAISAVLQSHMGLSHSQLAQVFLGFKPEPAELGGLTRS